MGKKLSVHDLISVIIPVYNTEKYIDQCIQSILAQTYTNWELLLIDDGSTDSSGAICDKYAELDNRIVVFHKENSGAQSSRDYGIKLSHGEWIAFIDSDDYIANTYFWTFIQYIDNKYDIIVSGLVSQGEISNKAYIKQLLCRTMRSELWGKLFRRGCVENSPSIPSQIRIGEDLVANLIYALHSQKDIRCLTDQLYHYRPNPSSITHTQKTTIEHEELFLSFITSLLQPQIKDFYTELNLLRICVLENIIVCKINISYKRYWIKELKKWSKQNKLTLRQYIILRFSNNKLCRYLLALERRFRRIKLHN